MSRVAAIHQPNFFPWLGYFDKIARADVFIVLDDAQHQKTGSNWSSRVKLLVSGAPRWVTAPTSRPAHGVVMLDEVEWAPGPWRQKLLKTLELNYRKAPYFGETFALIEPLVRNEEPRLAAYNLHALQAIARALGLADRFVLASALEVGETATERLVQLVQRAGCDTYLAGGGADGYQQNGQFADAGLRLEYQRFLHPVYTQHGTSEFVPGLSIIDVLMNCGVRRSRELLNS
jgi:hypothetical protein